MATTTFVDQSTVVQAAWLNDVNDHVYQEQATDAHAADKITNTPAGNIVATNVQTAINELDTEKAPLASPTFTGTVTIPTLAITTAGTSVTPTVGDNDTSIATTAFVQTELSTSIGAIDGLTSVNGGQLAGLRNKVINGGFCVNQRLATSVADDTYCLDRWYVLTETGNVTVAQQTLQENGTPFNIRLTQPDAGPKQMGLAQIIEATDSYDLRGKSASLKLRIRNSTGGQVNYAILEWSGTANTVTSDVVSVWAGSPTYVASITERVKGTVTPTANVWTDVTAITGTINAATTNLLVFIWTDADFAQNATLDIARVQLEEGAFSTPFEQRPFGIELILCKRYYEKSFNLDITPTQNVGLNSGEFSWIATKAGAVLNFSNRVLFSVEKRISSTITFFNPAAANAQVRNQSAAADMSGTATRNISNTGFNIDSTGTAGTAVGDLLVVHWTASAEL